MLDRFPRRLSAHDYRDHHHHVQANVDRTTTKPELVSLTSISPRTMDVLRRAARKAAHKQYQIEKQMCSHRYISGRHSALPSARLGAVSAPPNLGQQLNKRLKRTLGSLAPPIFVVPASKHSDEEELTAVRVDPLTDD